jgi:putative transposase
MSGTHAYPQRRHPRLADFDYATPGYYFITICTRNRLPLFGSIENGTMRLSPAGEMVRDAWRDLVARHPGLLIDTEIVMPDHVHAIVVLEDHPSRSLSLSDVVHRYKSLTTKRSAHGVRMHGWPRFADTLWQRASMTTGSGEMRSWVRLASTLSKMRCAGS